MGHQRAIKKALMKGKERDTKKVEHFFTAGKKTGMRITSVIGKGKFILCPGRRCAK